MKALAHNLKKYFSIFFQLQKIGIMNRMAYPVNFFSMIITVFFVMFLEIFFMGTVFSFFPSVAGWTFHQTLLVVGSYMIIEGMMWAFFAQLNELERHIKDGRMDIVMTKPIDSQFLVSVWRGDFEDFSRVISGIAVIWYSISNMGIEGIEIFKRVFLYIPFLLMGFLIMYSINLMIRCISFKVIEGHGFWVVVESITRMTQYPSDIFYNKVVKTFITFVVPLAFIGTVPAKALTGKMDWILFGQAFFITFLLVFISRYIWNFSLKHYSSASS